MADLKDVESPQNAHSEDKDAVAFEMDDVADQKLQNRMNEAAMDVELLQLEERVHSLPKSRFEITLSNPGTFTYILVAFASMGGMLSGLDQSLISGANLYLPVDLGLSSADNSLVNAGMPLGAVAGALLLSPANEYLGRRMAIIVSCILYTIGAALEAGAINFGMIFAGRFILGAGVGLEGGTVPVYVAECGMYSITLSLRIYSILIPTFNSPPQTPRQPRFPVPTKHCLGRSPRLCRCRHVRQRRRKLALHSRVFTGLFDHPLRGHALPTRESPIPNAQGTRD